MQIAFTLLSRPTDNQQEFIESCRQVRIDRDSLYHKLCGIDGLTVFKPDANFVFCRLPGDAQNAPEISRHLFIKHNMYIKHCVGKTQPDSDRYLSLKLWQVQSLVFARRIPDCRCQRYSEVFISHRILFKQMP
jgi:histidinol-phosphate/aromatic aminotransferase/cobyric acid decarboxylase-like protein